jgi:hypothetical protein
MSKFPLFDNLSKNIPNRDLLLAEKRLFMKNIEEADKNGHELIYALIRVYQIENKEDNTSFTLPYNGSYVDKNITFDLDKFPIKLKHILFKFLKVHLDKQKEEQKIVNEANVKRV